MRMSIEKFLEEGGTERGMVLWVRTLTSTSLILLLYPTFQELGPAAAVTEPARFLRAHSRCGPGLPPSRVSSPQLALPGPRAKVREQVCGDLTAICQESRG